MRGITQTLASHGRECANDVAVRFLEDGENDARELTFAQLDARARTIAGALASLGLAGERALLLFPPGLDYVSAFLGCLYAGAVAVPVYPPAPARLDRTLPVLARIAANARPRIGLTTRELLPLVQSVLGPLPEFEDTSWLAVEDADTALALDAPVPVDPASLAFLQYTSGSTGAPKGVRVTHGNLVANFERQFAVGDCPPRGIRSVFWLPPYHDMGLVGGILGTLYGGSPITLFSPLQFIQKPLRWLSALSRHRGTHSAAPTFALDLVPRKVRPEDRSGLDLSSWRCLYVGAEPVRAETLERFCDFLEPCGLRRDVLVPSYGLAEGTLIASGPRGPRPFVVREREGRRHVSLGVPCEELRVVDPETCRALPANEVGELWLSGPSVTEGYFEDAETTRTAYRARLAGDERAWLRTGDLGFLDEHGEVFVTGRSKDLVIIRGRKHYPHDLELTIERSAPELRPGCSVAFGDAPAGGEERLVAVAEVRAGTPPEVARDVEDRARRAVLREHEVALHDLVLVLPNELPKTSSGKLQRRATRDVYRAGTLARLA